MLVKPDPPDHKGLMLLDPKYEALIPQLVETVETIII
jgi:hypothetical protein